MRGVFCGVSLQFSRDTLLAYLFGICLHAWELRAVRGGRRHARVPTRARAGGACVGRQRVFLRVLASLRGVIAGLGCVDMRYLCAFAPAYSYPPNSMDTLCLSARTLSVWWNNVLSGGILSWPRPQKSTAASRDLQQCPCRHTYLILAQEIEKKSAIPFWISQ